MDASAPVSPGRIFISYRREDAAYPAGWLFDRLEIEAALTRNVLVIPVLVEGAQMPRAVQLPASLEKLAHRQAQKARGARLAPTGSSGAATQSGVPARLGRRVGLGRPREHAGARGIAVAITAIGLLVAVPSVIFATAPTRQAPIARVRHRHLTVSPWTRMTHARRSRMERCYRWHRHVQSVCRERRGLGGQRGTLTPAQRSPMAPSTWAATTTRSWR